MSDLSYTSKAMVGAALLGRLDVETMALISAGKYDLEFKCLAYVREFGTPKSDADLDTPEVLELVDRIKTFCRNRIQEMLRHAERMDELARQQGFDRAAENFRAMSKPSELGTVAELAAKYGKSKSEIRRLKSQNLLHTLEAF